MMVEAESTKTKNSNWEKVERSELKFDYVELEVTEDSKMYEITYVTKLA